ncbi:MAG: hypothetical protein N4A74_24380 [Carboxylicivirga sp.]|jgi:hypothetical protein|nr:hypothetical protein [Carboxylicivirga sp.]
MGSTIRHYSLPDADFIQVAGTMAENLKTDLSEFRAFDSTIQETYPEDIIAAIGEAKSIKSDMVIIDEMSERTQIVKDIMEKCNTFYKNLRYFVQKAFFENKAIQNQFGFNDFAKVKNDSNRMQSFLNDLNAVVNTYRSNLVEKGCREGFLDELPGLQNDLLVAKTNQELFKKERVLITQERVDKLNSVYKLLTPITAIASIIFEEEQGRLARYIIPRTKSSPQKDKEEENEEGPEE